MPVCVFAVGGDRCVRVSKPYERYASILFNCFFYSVSLFNHCFQISQDVGGACAKAGTEDISNAETKACCNELKLICKSNDHGNFCVTKDGELHGKLFDDFGKCCQKRKLSGHPFEHPVDAPSSGCK